MKYFNFQFLTVSPVYSFEDLSYDLADIFVSFEENPFIASVDMVNDGGQKASLLIATEILTVGEIEAMLMEKFHEAGRDPQNYILLTPESAEI